MPKTPRRSRRPETPPPPPPSPEERRAAAAEWARRNPRQAAAALVSWGRGLLHDAEDIPLTPDYDRARALVVRLREDIIADSPLEVRGLPSKREGFAAAIPNGPPVFYGGRWKAAPDAPTAPDGRPLTVAGPDGGYRHFHQGDEWIPFTGDRPRFRWLLQTAWDAVLPDELNCLTVAVEARAAAANLRLDPILPRLVVTLPPDRERGLTLPGGLAPPADPDEGRLTLFPESRGRPLPAILELCDRAGVPVMAQGRGAPLPLALTVEAFLSVPVSRRNRPYNEITWTPGELIEAVYPGGRGRGSYADQWARIKAALVETAFLRIPWVDHLGLHEWLGLIVRDLPADPRPARDFPIPLWVSLPPGTKHGPKIDRPALRRARLESAGIYRALLAVESLAWRMGRSVRPKTGGRNWARRAGDYTDAILDAGLRRRIVFGHSRERRHRAAGLADEVFERLAEDYDYEIVSRRAVDPRTGVSGWLVLPGKAAAAVARGPLPRKAGR